MRPFQWIGMFWSVGRSMRNTRKFGERLAALPMPELVPAWVRHMNRNPEVWTGAARPPSPPESLADAEQRLGVPLPPGVRAFYEVCDGFSGSRDFPNQLLPIANVQRAGAFTKPLSAQLRKQWNEWAKDDGDPEALRVMAPSIRALIADDAEALMDFAEADTLIALETPRQGRCIAVLGRGWRAYPAGTVFDVENLIATRYPDMSSWLGATAALFFEPG